MIAEVGAALRALYAPLVPGGVTVHCVLSTVDSGKGVSLFLAEVREDVRAAPADWDDRRDPATGRVVGRQPPVRRFDLLYLVLAPDEALLDTVLAATAPTRRLDPALLTGALRDTREPVILRLAPYAADAYARLNLPPRTVLGLAVSAPLLRPLDTELAPPAREIALDVARGAHQPPRPTHHKGRWDKARIEERSRDATGGQAG